MELQHRGMVGISVRQQRWYDMDKLKEILNKIFPNIPYDKALHFLAGFLIALIGGALTDPITGIGFAIGAGILKECYDHYTYGVFDVKDMVATWIGGLVGLGLVTLINYWRS